MFYGELLGKLNQGVVSGGKSADSMMMFKSDKSRSDSLYDRYEKMVTHPFPESPRSASVINLFHVCVVYKWAGILRRCSVSLHGNLQCSSVHDDEAQPFSDSSLDARQHW